jgi:hypothetical protein
VSEGIDSGPKCCQDNKKCVSARILPLSVSGIKYQVSGERQ